MLELIIQHWYHIIVSLLVIMLIGRIVQIKHRNGKLLRLGEWQVIKVKNLVSLSQNGRERKIYKDASVLKWITPENRDILVLQKREETVNVPSPVGIGRIDAIVKRFITKKKAPAEA